MPTSSLRSRAIDKSVATHEICTLVLLYGCLLALGLTSDCSLHYTEFHNSSNTGNWMKSPRFRS